MDVIRDLHSTGLTAAQQLLIHELVIAASPPRGMTGAERTRKWRSSHLSQENQCEVTTGDATVTNVTEQKETPPHPQKKNIYTPMEANASIPPKQKRGSRLPEGWRPSDDLWQKAKTKFALSDEFQRFEAGAFRDHWHASAGKNATKIDWDCAYQNWMREAVRRGGNGRGPPKKTSPLMDACFDQIEKIQRNERGRETTNLLADSSPQGRNQRDR